MATAKKYEIWSTWRGGNYAGPRRLVYQETSLSVTVGSGEQWRVRLRAGRTWRRYLRTLGTAEHIGHRSVCFDTSTNIQTPFKQYSQDFDANC
jgi:hypothetical protein